jgi:hypothetical protein
MRSLRHVVPFAFILVAAIMLGATSARAQDVGFRGGVSANPDQVFFGVHVESLPIIDHVHLRPNIEIGFGDGATITALNLEGIYKWPLQSPWTVYAGGGPAINVVRVESETDAEAGFNILGGLEHSKGWFVEAKFGTVESYDLKITFGYTLKR